MEFTPFVTLREKESVKSKKFSMFLPLLVKCKKKIMQQFVRLQNARKMAILQCVYFNAMIWPGRCKTFVKTIVFKNDRQVALFSTFLRSNAAKLHWNFVMRF